LNIELNKDLIDSCNSRSMYNRGNHIQDDANSYYQEFINKFDRSDYNSQQKEIYNKRLNVFKDFITQSFNEYLGIASNFVSVMVAGPAKYDSNKYNKVADRMDNKIKEIDDKVNKFYKNTEDMLKNAYSKDEILDKYRNGYDEPISSDDPMAKEKLQAKLEFLETRHNKYKEFNKTARKNGEQQLPSYMLSNSNQNIKAVKDRLEQLEKMSKLNDVGYYFNDGEVKFDKEDMRVKIFFDNIPNEETRKELKSHAFKWSPTNQAWQRKLTPDAIYTTKRMFKDIGSLEIIKVEDHTIKM